MKTEITNCYDELSVDDIEVVQGLYFAAKQFIARC